MNWEVKSGNTKIYIEMLLLKFINDYVNLKTKIVEKNNYVKEINKNGFVTNNNEVTVNEEKINNDNVVENNKDGNNDAVEEKNSMKDSNIENTEDTTLQENCEYESFDSYIHSLWQKQFRPLQCRQALSAQYR